MIEPILSLAFTVHANPGVYALLLGSGVSQAAGIPTGFEIIVDLVQKIASLMEQECKPDPYTWYRNTFGEEPRYTRLLDLVAKTPAERSQLIREMFEPSPREREEGLKIPTAAHYAIADLVQHDYIRVIVTTNFDQLLEKAIRERGITPAIISSPDMVEGALPLQHSRCTILKVNGDYADIRIKNTPEEVRWYDDRIVRYLERIFNEYGLVVCGWSAEWDEALGETLMRSTRNRFATYWADIGEPGEKAKQVMESRQAFFVPIRSADDFFVDLKEKILALETLSGNKPLTSNVAVTQVKKYLVDKHYRINLHDLVRDETERAYIQLNDERLMNLDADDGIDVVKAYIRNCENSLQTLIPVIASGCYWGETYQKNLWTGMLERIANPEMFPAFTGYHLELYPALLLLYAGGIASVASQRTWNVISLLKEVTIRRNGKDVTDPAAAVLYPDNVLPPDRASQVLPGMKESRFPMSDYLFKKLREPLKGYVPDSVKYERYFNTFESLLVLMFISLTGKEDFPKGRFLLQCDDRETAPDFLVRTNASIGADFFGSEEEFQRVLQILKQVMESGIYRTEDYCG